MKMTKNQLGVAAFIVVTVVGLSVMIMRHVKAQIQQPSVSFQFVTNDPAGQSCAATDPILIMIPQGIPYNCQNGTIEPTNVTGPQGPAGPTGPQGSTGATGAAGSNGTNAANPNFSPTASGLPSGSNPTVTLTGTYPNLNLAYGIPAGANGSTGPQGPTGSTGPSGPAGVLWYLNGVQQSNVRCDILTTTSASNGTWSVSYSGMSYSTILAVDATVTGSSNVPYTVQPTSVSTTGTSGYAAVGSIISVVSINVSLFSSVAIPVTVKVCGE
jgi:hypothetical protein